MDFLLNKMHYFIGI